MSSSSCLLSLRGKSSNVAFRSLWLTSDWSESESESISMLWSLVSTFWSLTAVPLRLPKKSFGTCPPSSKQRRSFSFSSFRILLSYVSWSISLFKSSSDFSWFKTAFCLIAFARLPKSRVEIVSSILSRAGEQLMIKAVRELPPRDSCSTRVSFEER